MSQSHSGIKNSTDAPQTLVYDGQAYDFSPGQTRILATEAVNHGLTRIVSAHLIGKDGKPTQSVVGRRLFEPVPLQDALKVATVDEDPKAVQARAKLAEEQKLEDELLTRLKDKLEAEGWKKPDETTAGNGAKGKR